MKVKVRIPPPPILEFGCIEYFESFMRMISSLNRSSFHRYPVMGFSLRLIVYQLPNAYIEYSTIITSIH